MKIQYLMPSSIIFFMSHAAAGVAASLPIIPIEETPTEYYTEFLSTDNGTITINTAVTNISPGDPNCRQANRVKYTWDGVYVCRTYKDAGKYEEWRTHVDFATGIGYAPDYARVYLNFDVLENLSIGHSADPSACPFFIARRSGELKVSQWESSHRIRHEFNGQEYDSLSANDPIPAIIRTADVPNCVGNKVNFVPCNVTADRRREACSSYSYELSYTLDPGDAYDFR